MTEQLGSSFGNFLLGYIFIAENIDRENYIKQSFKTSKISIITENSSVINDVMISENDLQNCKFPENSEELGSALLLAVIENHNKPIVIKVLNLGNEMNKIDSEFQKKFRTSNTENNVDFDINASQCSVIFNIRSTNEKVNSKFIVNMSDKKNESELVFNVNGKVDFNIIDFLKLISQNGLKVSVRNEKNVEINSFELSKDKLSISIDGESKINVSNSEIDIESDNIKNVSKNSSFETKKFSVDSSSIILGGVIPAVLSDQLIIVLTEIITACSTINIVDINTGINTSKFLALLPKLNAILSKTVTIK